MLSTSYNLEKREVNVHEAKTITKNELFSTYCA